MSVENEILRIQHNIANTYAAVSRKGGEVPLQPTSANLPAAVESIPQGPTYTAGDGIDITDTETGAEISVTTPVQGIVTQAEFNAMTEAERNRGLYVISDGGGGGSSAGEVYSTEEIRIGTWIDGKPLYRKTLLTTSPVSTGSFAELGNAPLSDIKTLVRLYGTLIRDDFVQSIPNSTISLSLEPEKGKLLAYILNGATGSISKEMIISLEYTKTTDEGGTA